MMGPDYLAAERMNVNVWDAAEQMASLVASKRVVEASQLEDSAIALATLAEAG